MCSCNVNGRYSECCGARWYKQQPERTAREQALHDLNRAVRNARRAGLTVEATVTESVVTTL